MHVLPLHFYHSPSHPCVHTYRHLHVQVRTVWELSGRQSQSNGHLLTHCQFLVLQCVIVLDVDWDRLQCSNNMQYCM